VVNLSLSGGNNDATTLAIARAADAGLVVVAAAGNTGGNARNMSPANAPDAITVSAFVDTDGRPGGYGRPCDGRDDTFWPYSSYGAVVDVAAPGACVLSTAPRGGYVRESGTSFAAPHVAGSALLWINNKHVPATQDRAALVRLGLSGRWGKAQASPCGFGGGLSPEPALVIGPCQP